MPRPTASVFKRKRTELILTYEMLQNQHRSLENASQDGEGLDFSNIAAGWEMTGPGMRDLSGERHCGLRSIPHGGWEHRLQQDVL